jgi:hypothetical protein
MIKSLKSGLFYLLVANHPLEKQGIYCDSLPTLGCRQGVKALFSTLLNSAVEFKENSG